MRPHLSDPARKSTLKLLRTALRLCALLFFLIPAQVNAQTKEHYPIGQVAALEGAAWYVSGAQKSPLRVDDPVYMNSTVATDTGSKLLILFIDDTQITLAENSELLIDQYIFDPYDSEENKGEFSVPKGAFHWLSGMLSKSERPNVKINTPKGSIGIRGTEFWAGDIDDGYGVFVEEGLVDFAGDWGEAAMNAGQGAFIPRGARNLERDNAWPQNRRERAMARVKFRRHGEIAEKLKERRRENIRRRHDYRSRMFPYKHNPRKPGYRPAPDEFFTDEFEKMRRDKNRNQNREREKRRR